MTRQQTVLNAFVDDASLLGDGTPGNPVRVNTAIIPPATFSGASVRNNASVNAISTVGVVLPANVEDFDTDGYHSGSSSRLTVPVAGYYYVRAACRFSSSVNGYREMSIQKNGNGVYNTNNIVLIDIKAPNTASNATFMHVSGILYLAAGDYIEVFALHDAGVTLAVDQAVYLQTEIGRLGL